MAESFGDPIGAHDQHEADNPFEQAYRRAKAEIALLDPFFIDEGVQHVAYFLIERVQHEEDLLEA
ncbi:hypothetical protein D3C86_2126630 [compost metagenome]